ncbi:MAG: hypothetical protein ACLR0U_26545 [Enterocloster clostridioformis]
MLTGDIKMQKYLRMDFDSIRDQYSNDLTGSMELASHLHHRKISSRGVCVRPEREDVTNQSSLLVLNQEDQRETTWYRTIIGKQGTTWFPFHEGSSHCPQLHQR